MNVYRDSVIPFTQFGGTSMSSEFPNFNGEENWITLFAGEGGFTHQTSMPDGYYPPTTWKLPLTEGNLVARNRIIGTGSLAVTGQLGYELAATLNMTGSGGITTALGELVADLLATLTGEGSLTTDIEGILEGIATLSGIGDINATIDAIAEMTVLLAGEGTIISDSEGLGDMEVTIRSYGSLTPEGIRDAVWSAAASSFNVTGTMGQKLNSAASGGVDYEALAEAVWDGETSGRTGTQAGKVLTDIKSKTNLIPGLF